MNAISSSPLDTQAILDTLSEARESLAKLPILGPAVWLAAKETQLKSLPLEAVDGRFLPPILLDQCRLYTRGGIPYAFLTWALVSDAVDARLRSGQPGLNPHEWQGGEHLWLIDVVAPFGEGETSIEDCKATMFPHQVMNALWPDADNPGQWRVRSWAAAKSANPEDQSLDGRQ